jgi:hypothetical protein
MEEVAHCGSAKANRIRKRCLGVKTYGTFKVLTLVERTRVLTREPAPPALELFSWRGAPTVMFTQISIERMISFYTPIPANFCRTLD